MKAINRDSVNSIREAIKSVSRRGATLQKDIQKTALACLYHCHMHGDWTLGRELIEGISINKGVKSAKLTQWFESFMAASYVKDDEGQWVFVYDDNKSHRDINMAMAEAVNWFDFKKEPTDRTKDLDAIAESVAKMFAASIKTGKVTEDEAKRAADMFATLKQLREDSDNGVTDLFAAA